MNPAVNPNAEKSLRREKWITLWIWYLISFTFFCFALLYFWVLIRLKMYEEVQELFYTDFFFTWQLLQMITSKGEEEQENKLKNNSILKYLGFLEFPRKSNAITWVKSSQKKQAANDTSTLNAIYTTLMLAVTNFISKVFKKSKRQSEKVELWQLKFKARRVRNH